MATKPASPPYNKPRLLDNPRPKPKSEEEYLEDAKRQYSRLYHRVMEIEPEVQRAADSNGIVKYRLFQLSGLDFEEATNFINEMRGLNGDEEWLSDTVERVSVVYRACERRTGGMIILIKPVKERAQRFANEVIDAYMKQEEAAWIDYSKEYIKQQRQVVKRLQTQYDTALAEHNRQAEKAGIENTHLTDQQRKDKLIALATQLGVQIKIPDPADPLV